jgi:hypothetical protein
MLMSERKSENIYENEEDAKKQKEKELGDIINLLKDCDTMFLVARSKDKAGVYLFGPPVDIIELMSTTMCKSSKIKSVIETAFKGYEFLQRRMSKESTSNIDTDKIPDCNTCPLQDDCDIVNHMMKLKENGGDISEIIADLDPDLLQKIYGHMTGKPKGEC